jgi:hypothetical protein
LLICLLPLFEQGWALFMTDPKAKTITGASDRPFERACYAVIAHDDGTGTVVLDWYETSVGRDFMMSEEFMRAEIDTARQIVQLLNQQLPGRVHAITEYPVSDSDALESSDYDWTRYTLDKGRRLDLAQRIEERLIFLLRNEPLDEEQDVMGELEHELEKLGEWVAMNNQTPVEYCTQVFLMSAEYITPLLESAIAADFEPESQETARGLVDNFLVFLPSWTHVR